MDVLQSSRLTILPYKLKTHKKHYSPNSVFNMKDKHEGERIAKLIARSGICSRRDAEKLIEEGRVKVDGKIIKSPALNVTSQNKILVDNIPLPEKSKTRLWMLNKPRGTITTTSDPQKRKTIFSLLPKDMPRVISIGRLDFNTEGLLLLTNNGELARHLELPSTGWTRVYRVRAHGVINKEKIAKVEKGVSIEGTKYAPATIEIEKSEKTNIWLKISIKEGKNREVRKLLEYAGLTVNRLIRVAYGPFQLGNSDAGMIREVPYKVIKEQINFKDI